MPKQSQTILTDQQILSKIFDDINKLGSQIQGTSTGAKVSIEKTKGNYEKTKKTGDLLSGGADLTVNDNGEIENVSGKVHVGTNKIGAGVGAQYDAKTGDVKGDVNANAGFANVSLGGDTKDGSAHLDAGVNVGAGSLSIGLSGSQQGGSQISAGGDFLGTGVKVTGESKGPLPNTRVFTATFSVGPQALVQDKTKTRQLITTEGHIFGPEKVLTNQNTRTVTLLGELQHEKVVTSILRPDGKVNRKVLKDVSTPTYTAVGETITAALDTVGGPGAVSRAYRDQISNAVMDRLSGYGELAPDKSFVNGIADNAMRANLRSLEDLNVSDATANAIANGIVNQLTRQTEEQIKAGKTTPTKTSKKAEIEESIKIEIDKIEAQIQALVATKPALAKAQAEALALAAASQLSKAESQGKFSRNVESGTYAGASEEYSPEDFQTAAQNQAQLARNSQLLTERKTQIANAIETINKQGQGLKTIGAVTVQAGDTLTHLAQKYDTSVGALVSVNPQVINADKIYIGDKLNIPTPTTPRKMTPAPLPPRKPTRLVNPGLFGIQDNLSILTAPDKASSITISGIPQGALMTAGSTKQRTTNAPSLASVQKATAARQQANRKSVESFLDRQNHTVDAGNYAGPSQEYSAEDFQSASQNRAQLNTETEIKSAMNTPSYRESAHPDFQKTRNDVQNAWGRVTERAEQEKRARQKQERTDEQQKATQAAKKEKAQAQRLAKEEPETLGAQAPSTPKQDTLGEATQRAKTTGGLLGGDPTQPSDIDRVMDRMSAGQRAKVEREKNFSWQDRSWSTMSPYDQSRTISAEKSRRRGAARSARSATPRGKNAYGEDTTGEIGSLGRGGQLSKVGNQKAKANQKNRAANKDGSYSLDAEGNGAGDAGGTVICTELYHQSFLPLDVYMADQRYGLWIEKNDPYVMIGYHFLAKPVVNLMQRSKLFTQILYTALAKPWASEMVVKAGNNGIGSARGKILFAVGLPVCRMIGRVLEACRKQESKLV